MISIRKTLSRLAYICDKIPEDQLSNVLKDLDFTLDDYKYMITQTNLLSNTDDMDLMFVSELSGDKMYAARVKIYKDNVFIALV
jgi:hypothetical protein